MILCYVLNWNIVGTEARVFTLEWINCRVLVSNHYLLLDRILAGEFWLENVVGFYIDLFVILL